jgi:hypothetical protein
VHLKRYEGTIRGRETSMHTCTVTNLLRHTVCQPSKIANMHTTHRPGKLKNT